MAKLRRISLPQHQSKYVNAIALLPWGAKAIANGKNNTLRVWDIETGEVELLLEGHTDWVNSVTVSLCAKIMISSSQDNTIKIWDLETGTEVLTLNRYTYQIDPEGISTDRAKIVLGDKGKLVQIWDLKTKEQLFSLEGHQNIIEKAIITPDNRLCVSKSWDCLLVWDLETGKQLLTLDVCEDWLNKLEEYEYRETYVSVNGHNYHDCSQILLITADSQKVVAGNLEQSLKIWDLDTGKILYSLNIPDKGNRAIAITPNGSSLITSNDNLLHVWDIDTQERITTLQGHTNYIGLVCVTADGNFLVSGSGDKTLKIWNLSQGIEIASYDVPQAISCLSISRYQPLVIVGDITGSDLASFPKVTCGG